MKSGLYNWTKISFFMLSLAILLVSANSAYAGNSGSGNMYGWMWSSNIGWISLNNCSDPKTCSGTDYGVKLTENTGTSTPSGYEVSGYAWSSNIGWISFNPWDWGAECPPSGCSTDNNFGKGGWARAINSNKPDAGKFDNRGGFDGWISLGGNVYKSSKTYGFNIDKTTDLSNSLGLKDKVANPIKGYGWGADVIGWVEAYPQGVKSYVVLDKKCDPVTDPTCNPPKKDKSFFKITASTTTPVAGETITITWNSYKTFMPDECVGSGGGSSAPYPVKAWTDKTSPRGLLNTDDYTAIHVPPNGKTTFTLTCKDSTDTYYDDVVIAPEFINTIDGGKACIKDEFASAPVIKWNTNDTSPNCTILAETFDGTYKNTNGPLKPSYSPSGYNFTDSNYQYKDTFYKLNCVNGDTGYEANAIQKTTSVKMCTSNVDFTITSSDQGCNYVKESSDPSVYESKTTILTLNPQNYTWEALAKVMSSPKGSLKWAPSSQKFTYDSTNDIYNTVAVDYTISLSDIQNAIKNGTYSPSLGGYRVESVDLDIVGKDSKSTTKSHTLNYCIAADEPCALGDPKCTPCDPKVDPLCKVLPPKKVKPKYVPF